ncbi:AAA family ATPase [Alkalilimnicola ehrlichii]|uniref:AAA family ATPase n=1 Tax=Alkalilimnicola ehrlichii TaxID=351052 RepID=A0A3E0WIL3_9GAMM|nr:ATP-binding protein [Alkalilimnicola ehrlichii]RFA24805.1 AAA family ATPase [Alkalilimnicola ehrlichii]RFA32063.1 AAA family ATPase [Alkalilimnicola ehrlichii]
MDSTKLNHLVSRAEDLLSRLESILPPAPASIDWSAPAFRWEPRRSGGFLRAIPRPHRIRLSELHNIERQKTLLDRNTRQFLAGLPANNALLWGSRGTGKSSLVKALLTEYSERGLRVIEVDKQHLVELPVIIDLLEKRPERFILFCDDLSFEADDPSYKTLKAILDGSLSAAPDNVLIYATSNRRHLLPEYMADNEQTRIYEGEIHHGEAVEEKISLSERFGLWVSFYPFDQDAYLDIVFGWLERLGVETQQAGAEIRAEALRFALARGSRSGRVAWQFARDWAGRTALTGAE